MIRLFLLISLFFPLTVFCQNFIGKNKTEVKKDLQKKVVQMDSLVITLVDQDSLLLFSYKDPKVKPVDFVYAFDKQGKCWSEKVMAGCDSCFTKYLAGVLAHKKYDWKKINENQYISRYADRMMIEIPPENKNFMYTILRTDWSKEMYELLKGN